MTTIDLPYVMMFLKCIKSYTILNLSVPLFLVYRRCSPVSRMVLLKEVVIDLYTAVTKGSCFINVLIVLNLVVPSDATVHNKTISDHDMVILV